MRRFELDQRTGYCLYRNIPLRFFTLSIAGRPSTGDNGNTGGEDDKREGDPAVPQQNVVRFDPHIVSKLRHSVVLKPSQTTTGLKQSALVIKQGVFRQGRTYIIELKVKHKGQSRSGSTKPLKLSQIFFFLS